MNPYVVFALLFLGLSNWIQLRYLLGNLFVHHKLSNTDGKGLLASLNRKTGLNLSIKLIDGRDKAIGFMVSSPPFKPVMIFSEKLYELLNKDEFEWVALHESGHYLMWHNLKMALTQLAVGTLGIALLSLLPSSLLTPALLSVILSILYIQLAKIYEYQADNYSVTNMDNPKGMISGNIKMKKANMTLGGNKILQLVWVIAVPYEKRIAMAEKEIDRREGKGQKS